jgi:hypothetical protein
MRDKNSFKKRYELAKQSFTPPHFHVGRRKKFGEEKFTLSSYRSCTVS